MEIPSTMEMAAAQLAPVQEAAGMLPFRRCLKPVMMVTPMLVVAATRIALVPVQVRPAVMATIVPKRNFVMTVLRTAVVPVMQTVPEQVLLQFAAMAKSVRKPNSVTMAMRMPVVVATQIVPQLALEQPAGMALFVLNWKSVTMAIRPIVMVAVTPVTVSITSVMRCGSVFARSGALL